MSWSPTIYVQFPNEEAARIAATMMGVDFPVDGSIPSGNHNYAMHAPMQAPWISEPVIDSDTGEVITPGTTESGYWAMLRLNTTFVRYDEIVAMIDELGVKRNLINPPVKWA